MRVYACVVVSHWSNATSNQQQATRTSFSGVKMNSGRCKSVRCVGHGGLLAHCHSARAPGPRGLRGLLHDASVTHLTKLHNGFDKAPILGKGAFATVYDVGAGRCVKIERLDPCLSDRSLIAPLATAVWAGGAGIAPRVHGWKVWRDEDVGDAMLALEMDRIDGVALGTWVLAENRSRLDIMHMSRHLQSCIQALSRAKVSHNDLHLFNVMVADCQTSGQPRPWIIDFTLSKVGRRAALSGDIHGCVVAEMWRAFEKTGPTQVPGWRAQAEKP